jgi:23S rRNA pseudouridine2605 synthase
MTDPKTPAKTPDGDRIAKVIARAGVASRRDAERMIEEGRVKVNGRTVERAALNVTPKDRVEVDGKLLDPPEEPRLWLYHKPTGLVTTTRDEQGRPTIFDDLPEEMPRVMSIGRLDLNSEGLLLLTNDGEIKRKLELPSTGWLRKYRVRVNGRPDDKTLEPLRRGIEADGQKFQPMIVTLDRQQGANAWLTVGLREGKNREIRRAMAEIGLTVNRLIRLSYGPFQLGQLKTGEVEEVRRRALRDQLGLTGAEPAPLKPKGKPTGVKRRRPALPGAPGSDKSGTKKFSSDKSEFKKSGPSKGGFGKPGRPGRPERAGDDKPFDRKAGGRPTGKPGAKQGGKPGGRPTGKPTGKPFGRPGKPGPKR